MPSGLAYSVSHCRFIYILKFSDVDKRMSLAASLSEEFKNQLAMQFGSSSGLADFVVPGAMPLIGSSTRAVNARRRQFQARKASLEASVLPESPQEEEEEKKYVLPAIKLQDELKATFAESRRYVHIVYDTKTPMPITPVSQVFCWKL